MQIKKNSLHQVLYYLSDSSVSLNSKQLPMYLRLPPPLSQSFSLTLVLCQGAAFIKTYSCEVQCEGFAGTLCFRVPWGYNEWENYSERIYETLNENFK